MSLARSLLVAALLLLPGLPLQASDAKTHAFVNAEILTATGENYSPGTLLISKGKIVSVGAVDNIDIPTDAEVHDLAGKVLIPGLVDSHSHIGVFGRPSLRGNSDGNEATGPVQSMVRALDSINPFDPGIRMAVAGGVTVANIMPGSANVIGGQTLYVKLRGHTPEQMWVGPEGCLGGLKMANGENPKSVYGSRGKAPGTRMKIAAMQRSEFLRAQQYQQKWDDYRKKKATDANATPPDVDLALEPLVEVLTGRRTVHFHTHRADDILTALRLKAEFQFDLVIQHGTEAYKVLDEIARHDVPVSITILDSPGGKAEAVNFIEESGAELTRAGIAVLINTDDPVTESRLLLRTAATSHRGGMTEEETLKAITINAARAMRLGERLGSLEAGKDADFVVLSGRPFQTTTRVLQTYIDGRKEFDLNNDKDRRYQTGGFGVPDADLLPPEARFASPEPVAATPRHRSETPVDSASTEFLVLAGRLEPVEGDPVEAGVVHVRDGKIVYAGPLTRRYRRSSLPVLNGPFVTPGLIDAHSVVPLTGEYNIPADEDFDEPGNPNQADLRTLDGFHPGEPLLQFQLQNGITLIHACPGRANVIAGLTGVFRTHGRSADSMAVRFPHAMLFNLGEAPKSNGDGAPGTRMGTAALLRQALSESVAYQERRRKAEEKGENFDRNIKQEHLVQVLEGKVPAMFSAHRTDDLLTAIRISEEFRLKPILSLATEAYLIRDSLAEKKIPVIVHPTMQRLSNLETQHATFRNAALLNDAGIQFSLGSGFESYVPKARIVRHEAALAMAYGLPRKQALQAVTLDAAAILGVQEQYGSLVAGKVADLVIYNGDPFEHSTHVLAVISQGRLVYQRGERPSIPLADRAMLLTPEVPCCLW